VEKEGEADLRDQSLNEDITFQKGEIEWWIEKLTEWIVMMTGIADGRGWEGAGVG
jgi:hypothetical protein